MTVVIVSDTAVEVHKADLPRDFFEQARSGAVVACDIETSGLNWRTDRIGTCQVAVQDRVVVVVMSQGVHPPLLAALLEDDDVRKVFHHAPFDLRFMTYQWGITARNVACTKIASKILSPELSGGEHSLKPVLQRHLNVKIKKDLQVSDWLASTLTAAQLDYAAVDVAHLIRLYGSLASKCRDAGLHAQLEDSYSYLPTRVSLDLRGSGDVFAY
ncbi:ribonuclease D [Arthrobacter sp. UYCu512]|uniref:ribonuclease D n=1 Tax=Arthrobacter sp. UYCu512 TaxID=3156338 RepID=UPI00339B84AA